MYFKNTWWYVDEQHSKDRPLNENYVYGDIVINLGMTEIIESWYKKNLKKKNHVIDVGANIGLMTAYFSTRWSKVTAFEPSPKSFSCLEKNCNKENIDLHNLGLSDKEDKVLFAQCLNSEIDQIVSTNAVLKKNWKTTEIPVTYLDKFNFDSVDLLKIDVEGHELQVVKGAEQTIKKCRPLIILEISFENKILDKEISKQHTTALDLTLSYGYRKIWYGKHDYILEPIND
jgi:FkbM family methyltransferase